MSKYNVSVELVIETTIQVEAESKKEAEENTKENLGTSFLNSLMDWDVTKTYIDVYEEEGED